MNQLEDLIRSLDEGVDDGDGIEGGDEGGDGGYGELDTQGVNFRSNMFMTDIVLFLVGVIFLMLAINLYYFYKNFSSTCKRVISLIFIIIAPIFGIVAISSSVAEITRAAGDLPYITFVPSFIQGCVNLVSAPLKMYAFDKNKEYDPDKSRACSFIYHFKCFDNNPGLRFIPSVISGLVNLGFYWAMGYAGDLDAYGAAFGGIVAAGFDRILSIDDLVVFVLSLAAFFVAMALYNGEKLSFFLSGLITCASTALFQNVVEASDDLQELAMSSTIRNGITVIGSFIGIIALDGFKNVSIESINLGLMGSLLDLTIFPLLTTFMSNLSANLFIFGTAFLVVNFDKASEEGKGEEGTIAKYVPSALIVIAQIVRMIVGSCIHDGPTEPVQKRCGYCNKVEDEEPPLLPLCIHFKIIDHWNEDQICCCKGIYFMKVVLSAMWLVACIAMGITKGFSISDMLFESFYPDRKYPGIDDPNNRTYTITMFIITMAYLFVMAVVVAISNPLKKKRMNKISELVKAENFDVKDAKIIAKANDIVKSSSCKAITLKIIFPIILALIGVLCIVYIFVTEQKGYFYAQLTMILVLVVVTLINYEFATEGGKIAEELMYLRMVKKLKDEGVEIFDSDEGESEEGATESVDSASYSSKNSMDDVVQNANI